MKLKNVVIVDGMRSPFSWGGRGMFEATRIDEAAAKVVATLMERNPKVLPTMIEDFGIGCVGTEPDLSLLGAISRLAGLPAEVPNFCTDRQCGSSMDTMQRVAMSIMVGSIDAGIALGVERLGRSLPMPEASQPATRVTGLNPKMFEQTPLQRNMSADQAGIGIKKIFSDDSVDRVQLFLRGEASDNFKEKNLEQLYAKYKGPMGKWNFTLGRMSVPFGLITEYDTEWEIIKTQELKTIGYKYDDGIKVSGFAGLFDYSLLISCGEGIESGTEDSSGSGAFKVAYKGMDSESFNTGLSLLYNRTSDSNRRLAGIDIIKYYGPLISRNEFVIGEESDNSIRASLH